MPKVICDMVNCIFNKKCRCNADEIAIAPNHYNDSNGTTYHEYVECIVYQSRKWFTIQIKYKL